MKHGSATVAVISPVVVHLSWGPTPSGAVQRTMNESPVSLTLMVGAASEAAWEGADDATADTATSAAATRMADRPAIRLLFLFILLLLGRATLQVRRGRWSGIGRWCLQLC